MARAAAARVAAPARRASARTAPARPARRPAPTRRPAVGTRTRTVVRSGGAALLDRLLHSQVLIGLVFVLLAGVVFANVMLLQKGRSITQASARATAIKHENARLRAEVARLGSSERIQQVAAQRGLVLPAPGEVRYLRSRPAIDARNASQRIGSGAAAVTTTEVVSDPTVVSETTAVTPTTGVAAPETTAVAPIEPTSPSVTEPPVQ